MVPFFDSFLGMQKGMNTTTTDWFAWKSDAAPTEGLGSQFSRLMRPIHFYLFLKKKQIKIRPVEHPKLGVKYGSTYTFRRAVAT